MNRMRKTWFWMLKNTLNRWATSRARAGKGPFSLVRHVGRKSGKVYETPIIVAPAPDGFIAELTYGENVSWYRNIVAAGKCELLVGGLLHEVVAIEPFATEPGRRAFGFPERYILRVLRKDEFRLLRTAA
jgi:deazaflavin-dependent oxidoreductase (nitroreductase family)